MVITRSRKEHTHVRIVDAAARVIRRAGCEGVGVADIMKTAGLTHGGFYAHFTNRDALLVEAIEHAGDEGLRSLRNAIAWREARGASRFQAMVLSYLANQHLAGVEEGCPLAALLSEIPRQAPEVQAVSRRLVQRFVAEVQTCLPAGAPEHAAASVTSTLVGALQLARALGDNPQGRGFLVAQRVALLAAYEADAGSS
jgi:TetR/AcrR family transcriptional regulator, transcriptional repressor for nem operon